MMYGSNDSVVKGGSARWPSCTTRPSLLLPLPSITPLLFATFNVELSVSTLTVKSKSFPNVYGYFVLLPQLTLLLPLLFTVLSTSTQFQAPDNCDVVSRVKFFLFLQFEFLPKRLSMNKAAYLIQ